MTASGPAEKTGTFQKRNAKPAVVTERNHWLFLPEGQRKARLKVCHRVADEGGSMLDAAAELSCTDSALWYYLGRHDKPVRERLAANGVLKRTVKLSDYERIKRLRLIVELGMARAAERLGVSYQRLYMFVRYRKGSAAEQLAALTEGRYGSTHE